MLDEIIKNEELTKEWVINYFNKKIENHEYFSFEEIKLMEACGEKEISWYCLEKNGITYEKGNFYRNDEKVEDTDIETEWYTLKWAGEPITIIDLEVLESILGKKIIFTEDTVHKIILRYLQDITDVSLSEKYAALNINIMLSPSNSNKIVYLGETNKATISSDPLPTYYGYYKKTLDSALTCLPIESVQAFTPAEKEFIDSDSKENITLEQLAKRSLENIDLGFPKELILGKKEE